MKTEDEIVAAIAANFRSFGGGRPANGNPVAAAMAAGPPTFAAGVDIREVVRFISDVVGLDWEEMVSMWEDAE